MNKGVGAGVVDPATDPASIESEAVAPAAGRVGAAANPPGADLTKMDMGGTSGEPEPAKDPEPATDPSEPAAPPQTDPPTDVPAAPIGEPDSETPAA